jgi:hypothetical protein
MIATFNLFALNEFQAICEVQVIVLLSSYLIMIRTA